MAITENTKINLPIKQLWSLVAVFVMVCGAYAAFSVKVAGFETALIQTQKDIIQIKKDVEANRSERLTQVAKLADDNSAEHKEIGKKVDWIIDYLLKKK